MSCNLQLQPNTTPFGLCKPQRSPRSMLLIPPLLCGACSSEVDVMLSCIEPLFKEDLEGHRGAAGADTFYLHTDHIFAS
jgi:hypothetical protein